MGWIDTKQAADLANLDIRTISKLCKQGKLKSQQWGRSWKVDEDDVRRYVSERRKPGSKKTTN